VSDDVKSGGAKIVRISSVGPLFRSGGFELSNSWTEIDLDALTEEQAETLIKRYGRWIRVYPSDVDAFEARLADMKAAFEAHIKALAEAKAVTTTATAKKAAKAGKES
jgi:hypothetical protein